MGNVVQWYPSVCSGRLDCFPTAAELCWRSFCNPENCRSDGGQSVGSSVGWRYLSYWGRESKSSAEALGLLEDPCGERFTRKSLTLVVLLFFPRQVRNSEPGFVQLGKLLFLPVGEGITNPYLSWCGDVIGSQHSRCPSLNTPTFQPVKLVVLSQNTQLNKTMSLGPWKCFISFSNLSQSPCGSVLNS